MRIDEIIIGERARKDMGDLQGLAASIKRHGLLHPVVVKSDQTLVAGHRRIEAVKLNGDKEIAVTVIDVNDLLSAERDENSERKDFTPTEAVAIGRLIQEDLKIKIKAQEDARKRAGPMTTVKNLGQEPVGESREVAAAAVGMSGSTFHKANAVVIAAESNQKKFGDLPEKMDVTGNVNGVYQEMKARTEGKNSRHVALAGLHHLDSNKEMQKTVVTLDGICACLVSLNIKGLDTKQTPAWAKSLNKSASVIRKIAKRIGHAKGS